jgi:hypothetical protein
MSECNVDRDIRDLFLGMSSFSPVKLTETTKNRRIVDNSSKIRNEYLHNESSEICYYINLSGSIITAQ